MSLKDSHVRGVHTRPAVTLYIFMECVDFKVTKLLCHFYASCVYKMCFLPQLWDICRIPCGFLNQSFFPLTLMPKQKISKFNGGKYKWQKPLGGTSDPLLMVAPAVFRRVHS